jgi:hypothetical protein
MKILVLVIASDQSQQYIDMQALWRARSPPADFDVWFVKSMSADMWIWSSDLDKSVRTTDNIGICEDSRTIFVKQDETFIPGILNKTVVALEYFLGRHEYTHVWRTNLSSVLDFDGLRLFLLSDDGRRCSYAGFCGDGFASGAGFLMIREAALYLVANHSRVLSWDTIDDVSIGRLLLPIFGLTHIERLWVKSVDDPIRDLLLDGIFHFRCESSGHINTVLFMRKVCEVIDSVGL